MNAACEGGPENPPREQDINCALAAVTGIGARDETEGMLATQMVATHFATISALRRLKGEFRNIIGWQAVIQPRAQLVKHIASVVFPGFPICTIITVTRRSRIPLSELTAGERRLTTSCRHWTSGLATSANCATEAAAGPPELPEPTRSASRAPRGNRLFLAQEKEPNVDQRGLERRRPLARDQRFESVLIRRRVRHQ